MQNLQDRLTRLQLSFSQIRDVQQRAHLQTQINKTLRQIYELPSHIANCRDAPKIRRASNYKKDCVSSGEEQSCDEEDGVTMTLCNCGCKQYYEGETYCNVLLNPDAKHDVPLMGCRVHISQHCRIMNRQCTACAAAAEAKAHTMEQSVPAPAPIPLPSLEQSVPAPAPMPLPVLEQSVPAPAPAPYRKKDSRQGGNSRSSSTRSRSRSRDNLEDSDKNFRRKSSRFSV